MFHVILRGFSAVALTVILGMSVVRSEPVGSMLALQRMSANDKYAARKLVGDLSPIVGQFAKAHSTVSPDYPFDARRPDESVAYDILFSDFELTNTKFANAETLYAITFDGMSYIAGVGSYVPVLRAAPGCGPVEADGTDYCKRLAENNLVCHLFLFDPQSLAVMAVGAMPIDRDSRPMPGGKKRSWVHFDPKYPNDPRQLEGWPRCHVVSAVASAKVVPNALLITLKYIDSAESISKFGKDQQNFYVSTSLLRFSKDQHGKVKLTQDQSCLGNPNRIASIAAARKALAACGEALAISDSPK